MEGFITGSGGSGGAGDDRPISAPDWSSGARLDVVDVPVPVRLSTGILLSSKPCPPPPFGVAGREVYTGSVAMVSFLLIIGMPGNFSSLGGMSLGKVALRSPAGISPVFLAALNSALFLCLSWSAMAASILLETIFNSRLLIFRSQYPERPPSSLGIQPHRKKTKNRLATKRDSNEKAQTTVVNTMPDRMRACR